MDRKLIDYYSPNRRQEKGSGILDTQDQDPEIAGTKTNLTTSQHNKHFDTENRHFITYQNEHCLFNIITQQDYNYYSLKS